MRRYGPWNSESFSVVISDRSIQCVLRLGVGRRDLGVRRSLQVYVWRGHRLRGHDEPEVLQPPRGQRAGALPRAGFVGLAFESFELVRAALSMHSCT